ncbi:ComEC/Rec2 family competence protein [Marivirga arenosa]|uniref:ComEC/Rec2 family competence protein n=1 Tax=Marivirga arenosa TaxID=3059076 RepID=A0AA49GEW9_9BACT|nr:ComEC/Rec2 family competence protein [Marivirga sp. BKB1-2]WKK81525.2 ComEC/Rec2 family competence protein [Marivirga sp. BKB1-2]
MNQAWNRYAFVRFVIFMTLGIIAGAFLPYLITVTTVIFLILSLLYYFLFLKRGLNFNHSQSIVNAIIAFTLCFTFGFINSYQQAEKHERNHLSKIDTKEIKAFKVTLISAAKETDKTFGYKSKLTKVKIANRWIDISGKAILYFQKDSSSKTLEYGDILIVKSPLSELEGPKNPSEFNYKRFLSFQQVFHQQYIPSSHWIRKTANSANIITSYSIKTASILEEKMTGYITNPQALAIAKALSLGIKDDLDQELKTAYATAGAMHVLAVSGLHVGIIYLIISFALKKWRNRKGKRFLFAAINILILWGYAFITGLSPSVQRAAMMFTFIILAQAMKRQTNIYNTLVASAFALLCINPFLIFSVGFQLSYLAVLGIVFFQPKIYKLMQFKKAIWDKIWAITCVSIAAQLVTAPLGLLYFHQFPTYFFLSNLVVIPASFIILNGTIILLVFSFWEIAAKWIGFFLDHFIQLINYLVFSLDYLPHNTIEGVYLSTFESWLIYGIILLLALFIAEKKLAYFQTIVIPLILLVGSITSRQYYNFTEQKITVYDTSKEHALSVKNGYKQYLKIEEDLIQNKNKLRFHIYPSQLKAGLVDFNPEKFNNDNQSKIFKDFKGVKFTVWNNKVVSHWYEPVDKTIRLSKPIEVDLLIVSNNAPKSVDQLLELFDARKIVVDASNNYYKIQNFKTKFEEEKINYYIVPEKGAFEWKL